MSDQFSLAEPPPEGAGLFGTFFDEHETEVVVIGVPWEVTVSYGRGTSETPEAIVGPSHQLDYFDLASGANFGEGVAMLPLNPEWVEANRLRTAQAMPIIAAGGARTAEHQAALAEINAAAGQLNRELAEVTRFWRSRGKLTAVLGGDHSAPLGHIKACLEQYPGAGVLHFDAHHDLRRAYEGFTYSHASIMYNVLQEVPEVGHLVSVGIRDFCEEEFVFARDHAKVTTFYDRSLQRAQLEGRSWLDLCAEIVKPLPQQVYVSFDIDGLSPVFCPNTGTPVPGGLSFDQAVYLLDYLKTTGRTVIGLDLCEVAPPSDGGSEWDLNVGARLLWHLCRVMVATRSPGTGA